MTNIKAVLFDLDNTILDRSKTFRNFTLSFVNTYFNHVEITDHLVRRIVELDQDGYKDKAELFEELIVELPWKISPELPELMEYYELHYVRNATLMEQAQEVVQHIKSKYKTGLITNGRTLIQYGKIDRIGLRNEFDLIVVSEEVGIKKPNPQIFKMALERLEVNPEECIYIGDHPTNDIEGAGKAGMKTIWMQVNQPWNPGLTIKPNYEIKRLGELLALL
ncbi:HAD family hydrolase [Paenibacillus antri]|uniref:HAD family hydrolase n=1 Tax=Paenibacillus antri TaxID=2582848 RepID=A0A5R9GKJ1_9BACL|nr:HAD family hydrolase [Paenibacillus antri]TLS52215.1 HAD family hydrolase [Paenibacillus antri]